MTEFEKSELRSYVMTTGEYKELQLLSKIQSAIADFNSDCRRSKLPLRVSMEYHENLEDSFRKATQVFRYTEVEEAIKRMKGFPYYVLDADREEHLKEK